VLSEALLVGKKSQSDQMAEALRNCGVQVKYAVKD